LRPIFLFSTFSYIKTRFVRSDTASSVVKVAGSGRASRPPLTEFAIALTLVASAFAAMAVGAVVEVSAAVAAASIEAVAVLARSVDRVAAAHLASRWVGG